MSEGNDTNGVFERSTSTQGQLTIPSQFRDDGGDNSYLVMMEDDGTIILHPKRRQEFNHPAGYRGKALEEYGRECMECGTESPLHVHHKDGNRSNDDIENLEVLCPNCHTERHRSATSGRHPVNIRVRVPEEVANRWKSTASEYGKTHAKFADLCCGFVEENTNSFRRRSEKALETDVSNSDINIRVRCADSVKNKWKSTAKSYGLTYGEFVAHLNRFISENEDEFRRFVYGEERKR